MAGPEIVRHVMGCQQGWGYKDAQRRVAISLTKMKVVRREGRVWLAPQGQPNIV